MIFENNVLNAAVLNARQGNTVQVVMLFSLIDGYLKGSITENEFLSDIKVLTMATSTDD